MRIIQVIYGYKTGDGVGNVVAALDRFFKDNHFETQIVNRLLVPGDVESELFGDDAVVFYHLSLLEDPIIKYLKCRKVLVFHNITDPRLLEVADEDTRVKASAGLYDAAKSAGCFDAAVAFSEYSRKCLADMGWKPEDVHVLPIWVRLDRFSMEPSREIVRKYKGVSANILFTGRIYPNKKQEDVIAAFAAYREKHNKNAKLFLVGNIPNGSYHPSLLDYAEQLGVAGDVVIPGHVPFAEYLAYYHVADLFLCMSAHEGFCIPLVEAMYFGIPIIAHASTAVPDTLGGSGVLLYGRDPEATAGVMHRVMTDPACRREVIDGQNARLKELLSETLEGRYKEVLGSIINQLGSDGGKNAPKEKKDNKYQFTLCHDLARQIELLTGRRGKCVVYGAGTVGSWLYVQLKRSRRETGPVLCDAYRAGEYDADLGCRVLSPEEAVEVCGEDVFLVSIQDRGICFGVVLYLMEQGIKKEQILLYDKISEHVIPLKK